MTAQTSAGYVSLRPVATASPTASTINFPLSDNRANGVAVTLGAGGTLSAVYKGGPGGATTALLFDVTGYFVPSASRLRTGLAPPDRRRSAPDGLVAPKETGGAGCTADHRSCPRQGATTVSGLGSDVNVARRPATAPTIR